MSWDHCRHFWRILPPSTRRPPPLARRSITRLCSLHRSTHISRFAKVAFNRYLIHAILVQTSHGYVFPLPTPSSCISSSVPRQNPSSSPSPPAAPFDSPRPPCFSRPSLLRARRTKAGSVSDGILRESLTAWRL